MACATDPPDGSPLVDDDESIKNRLFARAMRSTYVSPIRVFLRLAEHIAKGILCDFKSVASEVNAKEYIHRVATQRLEGIDLSSVTFNAACPVAFEDPLSKAKITYLRQWALWADPEQGVTTDAEVEQSFEFIRRNGGVTFDAAMTFPVDSLGHHYNNAYYMIANSAWAWAIQRFVDDPILAPGFNITETPPHFVGGKNLTPLVRSITQGKAATALQILSVTNDTTLNHVDANGKSALFYAVDRAQLNVIFALLCRPGLDMNNSSPSVYSAINHMNHMNASKRQSIIAVFDRAAALFAGVPHLIHETVYHDSCTTLPLPICDIIFNYYRMPYPIPDAPAAAAQTLGLSTATAVAATAAAAAAGK